GRRPRPPAAGPRTDATGRPWTICSSGWNAAPGPFWRRRRANCRHERRPRARAAGAPARLDRAGPRRRLRGAHRRRPARPGAVDRGRSGISGACGRAGPDGAALRRLEGATGGRSTGGVAPQATGSHRGLSGIDRRRRADAQPPGQPGRLGDRLAGGTEGLLGRPLGHAGGARRRRTPGARGGSRPGRAVPDDALGRPAPFGGRLGLAVRARRPGDVGGATGRGGPGRLRAGPRHGRAHLHPGQQPAGGRADAGPASPGGQVLAEAGTSGAGRPLSHWLSDGAATRRTLQARNFVGSGFSPRLDAWEEPRTGRPGNGVSVLKSVALPVLAAVLAVTSAPAPAAADDLFAGFVVARVCLPYASRAKTFESAM